MPVHRLQHLINTVPAKLLAIPEADFSHKPAPEKWSKKEIIGHLIDSAANNHQRFVRVQFEDAPYIKYDQNNWNAASRYQEMESRHVINFWAQYNQHLIEVVKRIPETALQRECNTGGESNVTLGWLIEDYVSHMEMHLSKILAPDIPADFIASLKYKTTEEGGRANPAISGYRPTIKFPIDKMLTSGQQSFIDKILVFPGDTVNASIKIFLVPHFQGRLKEGLEFIFTEGPVIIGSGVIEEIINESLKIK